MSPPPSSTVSKKPDWSRPGKESSRIHNVQAATSLLWEKIAKQAVTKLRKTKTFPEQKRKFKNRLVYSRTQEEPYFLTILCFCQDVGIKCEALGNK